MTDFVSTLPPSASSMERALEQVFWEEIAQIEREIRDFLNPYKCRLDLLPYLAWEVSVDDWDDAWDEKYKRNVVAKALEIHTYKGTRYAIDKSIEAIRADSIRAVEWFEDPDNLAPAEFRVELISQGSPVDAATYPEITRAINNAKNTRSHLKGITITSRVETPEKRIALSRQTKQVRSGPWTISSMVSTSLNAMVCLSRVTVQVRSGPLPLSLE
ncbi:phage tail protein I [Photobacterium sp. OFAV2-7]|uniref:phage tail protein I n=1 Tax=Photobacterium sp. OFAV2-7 TaxID=2917748 RepID=UPI001EF68267|nr:phage tail protein I [Photobacterium sp. OFAV2-7]MCG7585446.1 phage tail protein I [Photobacterium sp. OFAV2-7]